ncbi:MAG: potassium channel family protein [Myxococcota bacterium]
MGSTSHPIWFLRATLAFFVINALGAVMFFHWVEDFSWVNAVYFVATTLTTVGFGDINLAAAAGTSKLYAVYLMLSGAGTYSVLLALVVNQIVAVNLQTMFGARRGEMKDHIILCGHGNLGSRINEILSGLGNDVVVIESGVNRYSASLERSGATFVHGDAKHEGVLRQASIDTARCIVCATSDDLANLEVAIHAREINPSIRVVLSMHDRVLAQKVRRAFDFEEIYSQSGLAGPVFAHAAHDCRVQSAVEVGDTCHLVCRLTIQGLSGSTVAGLLDDYHAAVLDVSSAEGTRMERHSSYVFKRDDNVLVSLPNHQMETLYRANGALSPARPLELIGAGLHG